ncbi:uncharacterized protein LOC124253665 isoform X2 [Haliotis rubra]|uniref:uncharacterized protein LOC124253665 isoform X2 n=1 Tax=Haliotis rubra TaxID=36100 RepID=UPI001EE5BCC2|nr:uncharacterized protein LOC124253665 isoform X2 [Haliotis rubra]
MCILQVQISKEHLQICELGILCSDSWGKAVLFSSQLISTSYAAPLPQGNGRWVNPCGGSTPVSGVSLNLPTPPPKPINTELTSLKLMAQTASSLSDEMTYTIKPRIGSSVAAELDSHAPLEGFPDTGASFTAGIKVEEMLLKEVERLSKIGVFLEQAGLDTYDYTDKIEQLENKYVEMLCKMHIILKGLKQEVTTVVSRDIMLSEYRNLHEIAHIDMRNYLIIRDAQRIFVAVSEGVDAYMEENNL